MNDEKVTISNDRKFLSKITEEFLIDRFHNPEHKANLQKLFNGILKSLKVKEANKLLITLPKSIII